MIKNNLSIKSVQDPDNEKLRDEYKKYKNNVTSLLRNAELLYYSEQLETNKHDIAKSWKIIKEITGLNSSKSTNVFFNINGITVSDKTTIAIEFNNFFVNIGPELASSITSIVNPLSYVNNVMYSIVIPNVSEYEIMQIILSLKNSAAGWDEIPASVGKKCIQSYIKPLTYIINMSLMEGVFPYELKLAKVIPIYKSGDKKLLTNYRPISVLPFFSKIFEKVMYNYIVKHMESNNIIFNQQFGFRKKHSTQHAVISLINNITNSLDSDDIVISVFLDLKKAFDTISHSILLKKLYAYGIRGTAHKWFVSYLTGRTQYVALDDHKSDILLLKCGVPQGSILGPLLFIIYVNDICNVSNLLYKVLYADDTCVTLAGKHINQLMQSMNVEIMLLNTWLQSNKLSLNVSKTQYMIFHRARIKLDKLSLSINGVNLEEVKTFKYLGLIIDNKLKWIDHIAHVKIKISRGIGIIRKARPFLHKKSLCDLYYSFVYPYLLYCTEVWGNAATSHLHPLNILQNKIVRIITFSDMRANTNSIYIALGVLPLHKVVIQSIALIMYKLSHGMLPKVVSELYVKNNYIHSYETRRSKHLHIPNGTQTNTFRYRSVLIWNELINKVDSNVTLPKYKKIIKHFLQYNELNIGYTA